MRLNLEDAKLYGPVIASQLKLGYIVQAIADNHQINASDPPLLFLDPAGGAKDVRLPVESTAKGQLFLIVNTADAAEALTVKDSEEAGTIVSVAQNEMGIVVCDGIAWRGYSAVA